MDRDSNNRNITSDNFLFPRKRARSNQISN
nr:MAG TPA: hypothetical protein [Crassvirales sp.]